MAEAIGSALLSLPVSSPDGGWRDRVHPDAIGSQTCHKVDREGTDSCFRGRVGFAAQSGEGVDRADVDNRGTLLATPQLRNRCPTASDHAEKVELDHPDPHLVGRLLKCAVVRVAAGHINQASIPPSSEAASAKARSTEDTSVTSSQTATWWRSYELVL